MRKVLSFVLVLSLVLGSLGMAFAAPLSDVGGEDFEDAVNVLTELGVVDGYPDGTFRPDNIVTRGEMAKIVIAALGLEDYAAGTSGFSDMAGHWSDKYVAYAVSLGIINGYPDGTFRPNNTVTYDEAAKMLVAALGYTEEALIGTWPANWVTKAKVLGIIKGVQSGSAGANRGDIAIMTFQTLDKEMGKVNKDGVFVTHLSETLESDTMLTRLGAELYNPGVNRFDTSVAAVPGAAFVVTGNEASVISLKNLQGALVTAYQNEDEKIIAIKEEISTFITDEFTDAAGAGAGFISVNDKFGDYKVKAGFEAGTDQNADINNGGVNLGVGAVGALAMTDGDIYTVAVKISGNYITKIYSVGVWDASPGFGDVGMIDEDDLEDIKDGELFTFEFKQTNKDEVDLDSFALFGVDSLDGIEEDHVVYVYNDGTSATTYISRVEVGTEVVEGTVSKINSTGTKATVAGKEYKISGYAAVARFDTLAGFGADVGDTVELYLDYHGKVFDLDVVDGEKDMLALVVDWEIDAPAKMSDPDPVVKLFLADGTTKIFGFDDDMYIAANVAATLALFNTIEGSGGTSGAAGQLGIIDVGSVVEYSLNKDGEITAIEAIDISVDGGFDNTGTADITSKGTYKGLYIASDALIFTSDSADFVAQQNGTERAGTTSKNWGVTSYDKVLGLDDVNAFYHYNATSQRIDWMVIEGGSTDDDIFVAWNGWAKVDTDNGYEAYVLVDGEAVTYEATSQAKATAGAPAEVNAAAVTGAAIYKLKLASDGTVSGFDEVLDGVGDFTVTAVAYVGVNSVVKNNVLDVAGGGTHSLDKGVVVYIWKSGEWAKGNTGAFRSADYSKAVLYDIDGDDVYDYAFVR